MVKFYFQNVVAGKRKVTQEPKSLLQGVLDMLEANGYVINDDGTVSKKQQKTTGVASATLFLEVDFICLIRPYQLTLYISYTFTRSN